MIVALTYYKGKELFCMADDFFRFLCGDVKMHFPASHSDRVFKALSSSQLHRHFLV